MSGFFISYRRADNPDAVGRIYDRLVSEFGKPMVFKDVDSIPLGHDFRSRLDEVLGGCSAVLAIIGPRWTDARNESGQRRLEDPDDFVRMELEGALARGVPVVPVLVGHAPMPGAAQLPESLSTLAFRQAVEVRPDPDFHNDATRLVAALRVIIDPNAPPPQPVESRHYRARLRWLGGLAAAATAAAVLLGIPAVQHLREAGPQQIRTEITTPPTFDTSFALSPDGKSIVYVARDGGSTRLWLRTLSGATARPLPGTEGASAPFWAPDSQSLAFLTSGTLNRLDLASGQVQTLAPAGPGSGGSWSKDGLILYSGGPANPILAVSAEGGEPKVVIPTSVEAPAMRTPTFLPDGKRFLYMTLAGTTPGIYLASLSGGSPVRLTPDTSSFAYLPSGWLIWSRSGTLVTQRLDLSKPALTGTQVTLAERAFDVSTSFTGLIAYRQTYESTQQFAWRDRGGALLGIVGNPGERYGLPASSPDGRRVAGARSLRGQGDGIWLIDGTRESRITFEDKGAAFPVWSADGKRLAYVSIAPGVYDFFITSASGAEAPLKVLASPQPKFPSDWSSDGRFLLYFTADPKTKGDLWALPVSGEGKPVPLLETQYFEVWPRLSPDGRWLAYHSDESGRGEVYVRPFVVSGDKPSLGSGRWQISNTGGIFPTWRGDSKELYFIGPAGEIMAAAIDSEGSVLKPGSPVKLFDSQIVGGGTDTAAGRQYDVTRDGRFLINEATGSAAPPITLLQNWVPPKQ